MVFWYFENCCPDVGSDICLLIDLGHIKRHLLSTGLVNMGRPPHLPWQHTAGSLGLWVQLQPRVEQH